jgi:hypothetical protein
MSLAVSHLAFHTRNWLDQVHALYCDWEEGRGGDEIGEGEGDGECIGGEGDSD